MASDLPCSAFFPLGWGILSLGTKSIASQFAIDVHSSFLLSVRPMMTGATVQMTLSVPSQGSRFSMSHVRIRCGAGVIAVP